MFYVSSLYESYWYQITHYYQAFLMRWVSRKPAGLNTRTVKGQMSPLVESTANGLDWVTYMTANVVADMALLGGGLPRTEASG